MTFLLSNSNRHCYNIDYDSTSNINYYNSYYVTSITFVFIDTFFCYSNFKHMLSEQLS
jgi:hypothetical protein